MKGFVIGVLMCMGILDVLLVIGCAELEKTRNGSALIRDNWVSADGRRPAQRWEDYIEVEYKVDESISKDYLQGAIDVLNVCKDLLHDEHDKTAMVNLIGKLEHEKENAEC